jgi:putative endonuclease
MTRDVREKGIDGESSACDFLTEKGFSVIERNYHAGKISEIDIVAVKDRLVVFAEVKTRGSDSFGGGVMAVTKKKRFRMRKAGEHYLMTHPQFGKDYSFRFDLVSITDGETLWITDILR